MTYSECPCFLKSIYTCVLVEEIKKFFKHQEIFFLLPILGNLLKLDIKASVPIKTIDLLVNMVYNKYLKHNEEMYQ